MNVCVNVCVQAGVVNSTILILLSLDLPPRTAEHGKLTSGDGETKAGVEKVIVCKQ